MKKTILVLTILIALCLSSVLTAEDYNDIKSLLEKQIKMMTVFCDACKKTNDAKSAAIAINDFAKDMKASIPEIKALMKKYAGLQEMLANNPPDVLKNYVKKAEAIATQLAYAAPKLQPYMQNPEVQKAQITLMAVQKEMAKLSRPDKK